MALHRDTARTLRARFRLALHRSRVLQLALVVLVWLIGEGTVRGLGLPVPGGLVGLALALGLLVMHRVDVASLKRGADWLIGDMLLFFVPAVLAVLDHREFLGLLGLKVLAVILLSTLAVMIATALTVDTLFRWRSRHDRALSRA